MALTDDQIDLYSRQIILQELGGVGQKKLLDGRCLLRGSGPAFEAAATYLVGAGVGVVDLLRSVTDAPVAFAPIETRNPHVRPGGAATPALASYDVLLDAPGALSVDTGPGHARRGEIAVYGGPAQSFIDLVPSRSGCIACCAPERAQEPMPALDALQAGSLAALAALLWLAEIGPETGPRRMTLARNAPTWTENALGPTSACSRPCRP
ncbi:MAG: hypothetical protein P8R42_00110 [Candidatus Binatia bacterium]|nr:hypothetical protein [Candidatus Binatia bacterium]